MLQKEMLGVLNFCQNAKSPKNQTAQTSNFGRIEKYYEELSGLLVQQHFFNFSVVLPGRIMPNTYQVILSI